MTIGSKEIVANNVPATIDVAPFIRDNIIYLIYLLGKLFLIENYRSSSASFSILCSFYSKAKGFTNESITS